MTIFLAMLIGATSFSDSFELGKQAYENNQYFQAIEQYESLVYNRIYEPEVFYNLANAYYQQGDYALAMVNFERAYFLNPRLKIVQENIEQTRMQTKQQLVRPTSTGIESEFYFWHHKISAKTILRIAIFSWLLFWFGLILLKKAPRKGLKALIGVSGFVAFIFFGSWYLKTNPMELAVAQGDDIPVLIGTKETDTIRFELYSGDRVHIDAYRGEQVRITTATGNRGWVDQKYLVTVWPPERTTGM
jgi:tetratricopeptide (TPR) repeat protein